MPPTSTGPSPPLYNASFTLHRLSPLHFPATTPLLAQSTLNNYARRLQESLKGNILRGVDVRPEGNGETPTRTGPLQECHWNLILSGGSARGDETAEHLSHGADGMGVTEGIEVEIVYEKAKYSALLLREATAESTRNGREIHLPLLLSRMPNATRELFIDYLSTTFDTHAEVMRMTSQFVGDALEAFVGEAAKNEARNAVNIIKDLQLKLGFKVPAQPGLNSFDIMVRREGVQGFLEVGRTLGKTRVGQVGSVAIRNTDLGPFMSAVRQYLLTHLALDMTHDDVFVSRVACGAFALGREGKAKIFPPVFSTESDASGDAIAISSRDATKRLIKLLLSTATGNIQVLLHQT